MNKFVITYLLSIIFAYTLNAQTRMYDIYTPMGNSVTTWSMPESSSQTRQGFDAYYANAYPNAVQIKTYNNLSSTRKFNCHGYAWLRVERGIDRWIGLYVTTEEDIYMSDGSYTQVSDEAYPGKVSWGSGDHSAVTTSTQGVFISKWNEWPLMQHAKNYSPYGSSNLKYYTRSPNISGTSNIYYNGSSEIYYLNNAPSGTVTWTVTGPFSISPATGSSTEVTLTASSGSGTLTAKVNGTTVATKNLGGASPTLGPLTGPAEVYPGWTYVSYRVQTPGNVSGLTYTWGCNGDLVLVSSSSGEEGLFNVPLNNNYGGGTVHCTVTTRNGTVAGVFYMNVSIM